MTMIDQPDGEHEFKLNVFDRCANGCSPVCQFIDLNSGGEIAFQQRKQLLDAIDHLNNVRPRLALDVDDDGGSFVHPGRLANVFHIVVHCSPHPKV